ncbi:glycerophosphodiester phosphodiesterase family protein [Mesoflavibacter zeaxanthinifaciens]|uniref:glycerophosphodiester phosphodiesterase n=1 Tax=Mesoflavibacter zeaxanthinifaciens TaxID=393060 RepID=UPI0026EEF598|nr:glycerophosphodiester phosphodiesterase family protein [Mesoflavibacter zeaxanthinifaciens]
MKSTLKVGHRGVKGYISENTLPSIQKALDLNVDGIEIDVHLCASGELVVFHDFTLDRMTNGTCEIGKQTLSQLQNLLVDGKYKIPMLTEVLDLIKAKCLLNIELKGEKTALPTVKLLHQYFDKGTWTYNDILISSFQRKELEAVYNFDKKMPLGVLTKASVNASIRFAKTLNAVAIHPNFALLSKNNVKEAQDEGFKVNAWTVNDYESIERIKSYGVDAIISDYPDRI